MLIVGALLMAAAGLAFASTGNFWLLVARGNDRRHQPERQRSRTVSVDRAGRALARRDRSDQDRGVRLVHARRIAGDGARRARRRHRHARCCRQTAMAPVGSYRAVVILYAALGVDAGGAVLPSVAAPRRRATLGEKQAFRATFAGLSGLDRSRDVVMKLSALFALDSFGGGFVVQSFAAYWFYLRFGVEPGDARRRSSSGRTSSPGISALLASRLAARFGLINTMVAHAPAVQRPADSGAADADPAAGRRWCCWCGSASARWTCRRGSPTSWPS